MGKVEAPKTISRYSLVMTLQRQYNGNSPFVIKKDGKEVYDFQTDKLEFTCCKNMEHKHFQILEVDITNFKSPEEILKSINGNFDESQSSKMSVCLSHYNAINECVDAIEQQILKLTVKYSTEISLLLTIPGISEISAIFIIAEIGTDMNAFIDSNHLVSWAGLVPRCNESNNKKKLV